MIKITKKTKNCIGP